ncbi:two component, sigma54 specific, transcriptional regulator, Fis family [Geoalkalibacter ferrihydriticus]|uniref:Response regulator GlrR n=2 Tax=Geoalkalibacter ferrihydriticus TaxID=392333 RepID=A0A0C2ECZ0_9BACT|nr:sigma 54-interacting transcriptional regulator [Geoalkalibacter ferrihydriticus]KIH76468.1 response regulator GlrR [Geoalkalibacter ferrihydriticus DSM 17813]SDL96816.1 two component, sigma54 specific, transcriptional regulator, Fis family [Geoalkalibacter ferrihydriticus]
MNLSKKRILLVDDDEDLLRLLSMRLTGNGYEVSLAQSGEEALGLLPVIRPQLVITDLRMEGMDGMGLFDAIRKAHSSLPVIILTAHGSIPDAVAATKRGVFTFLTKPLNSRELLREVDKALSLSPGGVGGELGQEWRREIITQSPLMEDLLSKAHLAAASGSSVLILGESGTGKELLARAIHQASARASKPFVAVNCGAIPDSLLESELFGHTKGAFTGADRNYSGLFRSADGGTLFLDEIGDMPLSLQVKLLRVLQEKQVRSIGSAIATNINVRIISATHRVLEDEIQEGNFREDLYYRLNVVSLELPTLAERREDIPLLANHFLQKFTSETGKTVGSFSSEALDVLISASWPGNIRQLGNVVEQAVALSTSHVISSDLINNAIRETPEDIPSFADARRQFEQEYLVQLLKITNGNVSHAARLAKRNRTEFYKLLSRHHIVPTLFK